MGKCKVCGTSGSQISDGLGVCLNCIRKRTEVALQVTTIAHAKARQSYGLPRFPPMSDRGIPCGVCWNDCKIGPGETGFCGLVSNVNGRLVRDGGTVSRGILEWYYDPLPTNCVAWWFCPGCTGAGYPKYSCSSSGPERGHSNLAVFYGACSYDCLFCQNYHFRLLSAKKEPAISAKSLASKTSGNVSCICYFGGDPSVQMPHAIQTSERALENAKADGRIMRICWETNGYMKPQFLERAVELSFESGGNIKFDLKCWDERLSKAMCGVSNRPSLENFMIVGKTYYQRRLEVPVLTASTLLVPGYIDVEEIRNLSRFIGKVDVSIPYTLLAFAPNYEMYDLRTTSRKLAYECLEAAKEEGLQRVRLGNLQLLS